MITDLSLDENAKLPHIRVGQISVQPGLQQKSPNRSPSSLKPVLYGAQVGESGEKPKDKKQKISRVKSVKRNDFGNRTGESPARSLFGNPEVARKQFQNSGTVSALLLGNPPTVTNTMSGGSIGAGGQRRGKALFRSKSPSSSLDTSIFQLPAINEAESRIQGSRITEQTPKGDARTSVLRSRELHNSSEPSREQGSLRVGFGERKASDKYLKFLLKHQYREDNMMLFKGT